VAAMIAHEAQGMIAHDCASDPWELGTEINPLQNKKLRQVDVARLIHMLLVPHWTTNEQKISQKNLTVTL
jgi:hypothetical protein